MSPHFYTQPTPVRQTDRTSLQEVVPPKSEGMTGTGSLGGRTVTVTSGAKTVPWDVSSQPIKSAPKDLLQYDVQPVRVQDEQTLALRRDARLDTLPDREKLIALAGAPKKDFWFFGWHQMSTGYKKVLSDLDSYHDLLRKGSIDSTDLEGARKALTELKTILTDIEKDTDQYKDSTKHTRKEQISTLHNQAKAERELIEALLDGLENGEAWPEGLSVKDGLDFQRQGFPPAEAGMLKAAGISVSEARMYRDEGFTIEESIQLRHAGLSPDQAGAYAAEGFTVDEAIGFKQIGLAPDKVVAFRDLEAKPFLDLGLSLLEAARYRHMHLTHAHAKEFLDNPEKFKPWTDKGFSGPEAVAYRKAGMAPEKVEQFKGCFVPAKEAKEYLRLSIPYMESTRVGELRDTNLTGPMKILGSGEYNTVYKGTYKLSDGSEFKGVYKEEQLDSGGWVALKTGIDQDNAQLGMRNVATSKLNDLLGFHVIPKTELGIHEGNLGVVMGLAPGTSPIWEHTIEITDPGILKYKARLESDPDLRDNLGDMYSYNKIWVENGKVMAKESVAIHFNFKDPVLRRELTKLQWLDALTAQGDRHGHNYMVELDKHGKALGVMGIDNDQAFGKLVLDPNEIQYRPEPKHSGFHGCKMPNVIDTETRDAFMSLTPEMLESTLKGLLTDEEIEATKSRLDGIKNHIQYLEAKGRVIDPDEWGSPEVEMLLKDKNTSYVGRDMRYFRMFEYVGRPVDEYSNVV